MEKPDYTTLFHTESRYIAHELLDLIAQAKEDFIPDMLATDPVELRRQEEANADFGIKVLQLLATKNIPSDYATMCIDKIIQNLTGLKAFINGSISSNEHEYLSRAFGKKDYKGKFRREEATVGDLLLKVNEIREATGGNKQDYFEDEIPETPSPYAEKLADKDEDMV